jgi:hypothetical protein
MLNLKPSVGLPSSSETFHSAAILPLVQNPLDGHSLDSAMSPQLRILVVDDDSSVRSACAEIAASLGFATEVANSVRARRWPRARSTLSCSTLSCPGAVVYRCWTRFAPVILRPSSS